ncbi:CinA family protein [Methylomarinum sp. Ch1-1]|uniref:CinA family protein n=1 Tax=Methylomarinum roseum TaxID=3067653 RepID=A0AAU7NPV4_9GAMM|nr:CinA family protein [Methylomarinum sp. Ch1-1]MDP4521089.1 CinA family protein [Methylomarinum sp. Ch1-1]
MDIEIFALAEQLGAVLESKGVMIAVAESCTGGGICQVITEVPGSSAWFDRGFVTYSNDAKKDLLGVKQASLEQFGAVSQQVATEMAAGALQHSLADITVAVTGLAGPGGATLDKPVGTVFIAWKHKSREGRCERFLFSGSRAEIRQQTIKMALKGCLELGKNS